MYRSGITYNGSRGTVCFHSLAFVIIFASFFYNSNFCSLFHFTDNVFDDSFFLIPIILFTKQYLGDSVGPFLIFGLAGVVFYMRYQQRGKQSELLARAAQLRGSQQNLLNSKMGRRSGGNGNRNGNGGMMSGGGGSMSFTGNSNRFASGAGGTSRFGGDGRMGMGNSVRYRGGGANANNASPGNTNFKSNSSGNSNVINGTVEISTTKPKKKERRIYTGRRRKRRAKKKVSTEGIVGGDGVVEKSVPIVGASEE